MSKQIYIKIREWYLLYYYQMFCIAQSVGAIEYTNRISAEK